jgi:GTPase SAR1 family protein
VGKSNLIDRYTKDQFREETKTTIGVEFGHKNLRIEGKDVKVPTGFRLLTRPRHKFGIPPGKKGPLTSLSLSPILFAILKIGKVSGSNPRILQRCHGSSISLQRY